MTKDSTLAVTAVALMGIITLIASVAALRQHQISATLEWQRDSLAIELQAERGQINGEF